MAAARVVQGIGAGRCARVVVAVRLMVAPALAGTPAADESVAAGTERRVGLEVGRNFKQMLDDLNVRRNTWWGLWPARGIRQRPAALHAVGFRFDMNHGRWHGPNAGR